MTVTSDIKYVGVTDRVSDLFEGQYKIPNGITYNSYVILDTAIAVMDTVDAAFTHEWLDNLAAALDGRRPTYLVVTHMEPDHSANVMKLLEVYPEVKVVSSAKAFSMMKSFFGTDLADNRIVVKDGDELPLGEHTLTFFAAPMVHWPEVTVVHDNVSGALFSADAFGRFGADMNTPWTDDARRYYIGIVGKYGAQVMKLFSKLEGLDIRMICPLHGPVLRDDLSEYISLYKIWASYEPESIGTVIAYTSVYGNTAKAAKSLFAQLKQKGVPRVEIFDLARCDFHEAVAAAFKYSDIILATTTYNGDMFPAMRSYLDALSERGFKNRRVGIIENGSWAPVAAKLIKEELAALTGIEIAKNTVTVSSALDKNSKEALTRLADEISARYELTADRALCDASALFNIGYGLYVVTSHDGVKDNGIILNTVTQITNTPNRIAVCINKESYSYHTVRHSGRMNVNCLTVEAPFHIFETFGFQSGRAVNKFDGITPKRSKNGLAVLPEYINSYISLSVESYVDLDTHGMFICTIDEAEVISDKETMTYTYYQSNVKPKPKTEGIKGYVCKVCGYVYEGDDMPDDYICPLCKHGKDDFEPIQ